MRKLILLVATALLLASCALPSDVPSEVTSPKVGSDHVSSVTFATSAEVQAAVQAAQTTATLPTAVPSALTKKDEAGPTGFFDCRSVDNPAEANPYGQCAYGAKNGQKLMVIYGDSRSAMWAATLEGIAANHGWKLRAYGLGGCPAPDLQFLSYQTNAPSKNCDTFHQTAVEEIAKLKPDLVLVTSVSNQKLVNGEYPSSDEWRQAWVATLTKLKSNGAPVAMIGDIPTWENSDAHCLAAHVNNVQDCAVPVSDATPPNLDAERAAAEQAGALYVPTTQWVCAERCQPLIADKLVYNNRFHFTGEYARYLSGALGESLQPVLG